MVAPTVTQIVDPVMNKISSGLSAIGSTNKDEGGSKSTCAQSTCIALGVINIIIQACVVLMCCMIVGAASSIFAEWIYPWHHWRRDDVTITSMSNIKDDLGQGKKGYEMETIMAMLLAIVGPYILMSASFISLGMSIALIHGVVKKSASTVKAFIIFSSVVLPMCLVVNIFYMVMIWVHGVTDPDLFSPHIAVLIFNIIFATQLLLACKTYTQLKNSSQFNATRLQEF